MTGLFFTNIPPRPLRDRPRDRRWACTPGDANRCCTFFISKLEVTNHQKVMLLLMALRLERSSVFVCVMLPWTLPFCGMTPGGRERDREGYTTGIYRHRVIIVYRYNDNGGWSDVSLCRFVDICLALISKVRENIVLVACGHVQLCLSWDIVYTVLEYRRCTSKSKAYEHKRCCVRVLR